MIAAQLARVAFYAARVNHVTPRDLEPEATVEAELPGVTAEAGLPAVLRAELIALRRDLHMHPELGNREFRTTAAIKARLEQAALAPRVLATGIGLVCDIDPARLIDDGAAERGEGDARSAYGDGYPGDGAGARRDDGRPFLVLRADIDALPIPDTKTVAYRSTVPDRAHACGHDVHTTVVLGAGLVLAELAREGRLPHPVRLIFQPAEEVLPGGAADIIEDGVLDGVGRIIAVHCDPRVDVGRLGLRVGPITSACDRVEIALDGAGGHTARPHLTTDMVTPPPRSPPRCPRCSAAAWTPAPGWR